MRKAWRLLPDAPETQRQLAQAANVSPILAQLFLNRSLTEPAAIQRFLEMPLSGLHPPELLPGIPEAVAHLSTAVASGQKICIYGDYDVDGTTGIAILVQTLQLLGSRSVEFYVPHRLEEGYGLNADALRQLRQADVQCVVTVDCGISSVAEADLARELGLDLLITDHHELPAVLPAAKVLVHPRLPGSQYPFPHLSGSGVAFKLAWALCQHASKSARVLPRFREFLLESLVLAALGTVADVVPLLDENRLLVRHGLDRLQSTKSLGLQALLATSKLTEKKQMQAADIGYRLAPQLNAVGRLGCARRVVELLLTQSPQRADDLARDLHKQNEERQLLERRMLKSAQEQVGPDPGAWPALVLAHEDWHAGVVGIVASRLVELYARPALLVAWKQEHGITVLGQGSGRSIPGLALHEGLRACSEFLLSHGGHQAAAGFKIKPEHFANFREKFLAFAADCFPLGVPDPVLSLDVELPLSGLTFKLIEELKKLEPYGQANREPIFLAGDLQIVGQPTKVGSTAKHLRFQVRQGPSKPLWCIAFGLADRLDELLADAGRCCLAFVPQLNEWNGFRSVQLHVLDFQAGPSARLL